MIRPPLAQAQDLLLLAFPAGGQQTARRNAWAAMSAGVARSRARDAAEAALAAAEQRVERRAGAGS